MEKLASVEKYLSACITNVFKDRIYPLTAILNKFGILQRKITFVSH